MERFLGRFANRIISVVLILCMSIGLCACGKDDESQDIRNFIFSAKEIEFDEGMGPSNLSGFELYNAGDETVLYGTESKDEDKHTAHFVYLADDGTINFYYVIDLGPDQFVNVAVSEAGDVYGILWTKDREENMHSEDLDYSEDTSIGEDVSGAPEYGEVMLEEQLPEDTSVEENATGDVSDEEVMPEEEMSGEEMPGEEMPEEEMPGEEMPEEMPGDAGAYADGPEEPMEPEERTPENGYYYELCKINNNGEIVIDKNLQDYEAIRDLDSLNREWAISSMIADNKNVYLLTNEGDTVIFDLDLNLKKVLSKSKTDKKLQKSGSLLLSNDNNLYVKYTDSAYNVCIADADLENGKVGLEKQVPGEKYYVRLYKGINKDFSILKNNILYEFDAGDDKFTEIMDFVASNIPTDYVSSAMGVDEMHFFALYNSMEDNKTHLSLFSKVDPSLVKEKTIINLATLSSNELINKAVIDFNKNHEDYNIRIIDYNSLYGTDKWEISEEALNKLNTDIISGKMPDLLIQYQNALPLQTYINKGLLEDLNNFIDEDPEFSRDDFLPNVMEALSKDGHLYQITPGYSISTVLVKKSHLKGRKAWTMGEALDVLKESGCSSFFDKTMSRSNVMTRVLMLSSSQFYNLSTAECSFDSDNFKDVLRFIESFPSEVDWGKMNIDWNAYEKRYKANVVLASDITISSFSGYISLLRDYFNEPVEYIGFPTTSGNGSSINSEIKFCVSSKSKYKDICWEFLRFFLTEDFQRNDTTLMQYSIPIRKDVFRERLDKMKETLYYEYTFMGETIKEPVTMMGDDGDYVPTPPFTEEEYKDFEDFFYSVNTMNETDVKVMQILSEECMDYFNGKATIDDCAKRIQSRVQIYLYESQ